MVKKQLIMEKSLELFAKQGFEATSVQQITEHCGISKGAFYLAFKSKDELIFALIDHFMMQIISDIDRIVSGAKNDELLFEFYYTMFNSFLKHADFAKIFMKEQAHTFNEEFMIKMRSYDITLEKIILSMIERLYGEEVNHIKYDLIYCIKSFMNTYSQLFLFHNVPLDVNLLSQTLVEKTNILAKHTAIPFVSQDLFYIIKQPPNEEITKEQILEMMEQKIEEIDESIEKESLILLKQQLLESAFSPAIIKGLLENIRNHPQCKWISFLLCGYFGF